MSSVKVPGYLLKQIKEALCRAFPSKTKLQMMVRFQFSQNLDEIALGENLDEIAYKLVEHFEKQNKLEKLIKGAFKANGNNSGLEKIVKKTHITISLLEILQPLEDKYLEEMQRAAYEACYSENHLDPCWKNNTLDSLNDILDGLDNIPQKENHEQLILQFVVGFLVEVQNKLPSGEEKNLRQWCEDNFNDFSQLLEQIKNERLQREEQKKNTSSDLIVILRPSQQYKKSYLIKAWFIPNGEPGKSNPETGEGYIPVTPEEEGHKKFEEKEIANLLTFCFHQVYQEPTFSRDRMSIEFFLPYELLNQPIDDWKIADEGYPPSPIGIEYKVIVRSYKRLNEYIYRNDWEYKWNNFKQFPCSKCFVCGDDCCSDKLYSKLLDKGIAVCKLIKPPSQEIFKFIDRSAIPVALWIREELQNLDTQGEIDKLFESSIIQLPERVKEKRLQAARDKRTHVGHHISLLWENPYILPPKEIKYTTP
ncbi:effector-associated domain EAD1-containing protein [Mastigocoleus sp. MO_188.B34]|uniref:VMAP-C domain-containing protein n=1 Tax=Mastigocoleus sp. MO_188.B34 TaxID=3036635 RepID=UPI00262EE64D|nr:effector-associated domain EAD1-containing protein [Mastigocoleus sp. MO_188.B34]MDJ0698184.1 effector-associated domain EAD1-containing protein [Mastigocoleus sp. MO_188.B34]